MESVTSLYARQEELGLSIPEHIVIIGCGGIGSWIALELALAGVPKLDLYDEDRIEASNLNRTPYKLADIGRPKAQALADLIRERRPECDVIYHGHFDKRIHSLSAYQVICAVDKTSTRREIKECCDKQGRTYWDIGAEAYSFTLSNAPADWSFGADTPGYFTQVFIAPVAAAASFLVWRMLAGYGAPELQRVEFRGEVPRIITDRQEDTQNEPEEVEEVTEPEDSNADDPDTF